MILTAGEKSIVERLKLTIDAYKRLRDDGREQEDHENGDEPVTGRKYPMPLICNKFTGDTLQITVIPPARDRGKNNRFPIAK